MHAAPRPLIAVIFSDDPVRKKKKKKETLSQDFNFLNILYYCAHYEDNIYNPYATESCLLKHTNQKKEKSISDLLVMACPDRVVFCLSLVSSSSELMKARKNDIT